MTLEEESMTLEEERDDLERQVDELERENNRLRSALEFCQRKLQEWASPSIAAQCAARIEATHYWGPYDD